MKRMRKCEGKWAFRFSQLQTRSVDAYMVGGKNCVFLCVPNGLRGRSMVW